MEKKPEVEELHVFFHGERLSVVERVARLYVRRPWQMFAGVWALLLIVALVVLQAGWFDIADMGSYDWTIPTSEASQNDDALADARESVDTLGGSGVAAVRSEKADFTEMSFIYEWSDEDRDDEIITAANLQRMCKFQSAILKDANHPKFCNPQGPALGQNTVCASEVFDVVAKAYPTPEARVACAALNSTQLNAVLSIVLTEAFGFHLERDIQSAADTRRKLRSQLQLFGPLGADSTPDGKTYSAALEDDSGPQAEIYKEFLLDVEKDIFAAQNQELSVPFGSGYGVGAFDLGDGLQVRMENFFWRQAEFDRIVSWDTLLVSASFVFVFGAVMAHTRSLWITINGMFSVLMSFPMGIFVYTAILGIEYFGQIHIVALYVVLAVGSSAVFQYVDAFKQSELYWVGVRGCRSIEEAGKRNIYGTGSAESEVLVARLAYTYIRAIASIGTTSATTAGAFLATGVSPVAPVAAFGFFAALAVLSNFLFSLILYPAFTALYEMHFVDRPFCGAPCRPRRGHSRSSASSLSPAVVPTGRDGAETASSSSSNTGNDNGAGGENDDVIFVTRAPQKETWEERIFSRGYVPFIERTYGPRNILYVALTSVVVVTILFSVMSSYAFLLDTPTEQDEPFGDGHMSSGFRTDYGLLFKGGTDFQQVSVTFGIKGIDRDGFSKFDPNGYRGRAIFDNSFDLAPRASQEFVLDLCDDLLVLPCSLPGCVSDDDLAVRSVECTLRDFHTWHNDTYFGVEPPALDLGESNATLWTERVREYVSVTAGADQNFGFIDGRLRFFVFKFEATLKLLQPVGIKEPVLDLLTGFLDRRKSQAPPGMRSYFPTSFDLTWIATEKGLVTGMFTGLAVSLAVCSVVLLLATSNAFLSLLAILAIGATVGCVLGLAQRLGWALGVSEAISAIMVVGLSVDHVTLHFVAYMHAGRENIRDRAGRFRYSAVIMGPTVVAGAITTAGCGLMMLACTLSFFTRMAILLSTTMGFSLIITEFFAMPIVLLIGPENDRFDVALWAKARREQWKRWRGDSA